MSCALSLYYLRDCLGVICQESLNETEPAAGEHIVRGIHDSCLLLKMDYYDAMEFLVGENQKRHLTPMKPRRSVSVKQKVLKSQVS